MILNGIDFGDAWCSSGARNFFGDGYRAHRMLGPLRPRWEGSTFVAKTSTFGPRAGNMPLNGTEPVERLPACIKINFRKAAVLNAVGLAGPGLHALLNTRIWQTIGAPFLLSYASTAVAPLGRLDDARDWADAVAGWRLRHAVGAWPLSGLGVELNFSCPNVGHVPSARDDFVDEVRSTLVQFSARLEGAPLVVKFNALVPVDVVRDVTRIRGCAAVCVSNTIPWGSTARIGWAGLFGPGEESPLAHLGGGGLSGAPIYPLVRDWVAEAAKVLKVPIVAGGGVVSARQALELLDLGASAIELGSVAIVRPWRVAGIIRAINARRPTWS